MTRDDPAITPRPSIEEQYRRDLEVIQRCEDAIVAEGGRPSDLEFFDAMGSTACARSREGGRGS